jgi:ATP-binding cassette subfamily C protein CydCD
MIRDESRSWAGLLAPVASHKRLLAAALLAAALAQATVVGAWVLAAWIAGQAAMGAPWTALQPALGALALTALVAALSQWWQTHASHALAFALIETLQLGIYDGLERGAGNAAGPQRSGDIAATATADAELMEHFYAHMLGELSGALCVPLAALGLLAWLHPLLALAWLPFVALPVLVSWWLAGKAQRHARALAAAQGELNADVVEGLRGLRELALLEAGPRWLARMRAKAAALSPQVRRHASLAAGQLATADPLPAVSALAMAAVAAWLLDQGHIDAAWLPAVVVLAGMALAPLAEVAQAARRLGDVKAGADRIVQLLRQPRRIADSGTREAPATASLDFCGVHWQRGGVPVLRGLDLSLRPGEMVALAGASGAGKSSCVQLLQRLGEPDAGSLRMGGMDIRELPLAVLRQQLAVVRQEVHLFDISIADNIRLGRPDASDDEVQQAAMLAQAHGFISGLPQGHATRCGEQGMRLSGGQRQRIALARALLTGAPVLVLDEASSHLDSESEQALLRAQDALREHRTVLLIAHRPAMLARADRVALLEGGRIVEQGTHRELLALQGAYASLMAADA